MYAKSLKLQILRQRLYFYSAIAFGFLIVSGCSSSDKEPSDSAAVDVGDDGSDNVADGSATEPDSHSSGGDDASTNMDSATPDSSVEASDDAAATGGEGGSSGGDGGTGGTGGTDGEPLFPECGKFGDTCISAADCCSGLCDPATDTCVSSLTKCAQEGDACESPTDCCSLRCVDEECASSECLDDNDVCTEDSDCCSSICTDETCIPLNLDCKTAGNSCNDNGECCSNFCDDDRCQLAASFCIQEGDLCTRDGDCCTLRCDLVEGQGVGVCGPAPEAASFCTDGVEGSVCEACNDCCSRLCAPYAPTGVFICQPASGCHVTGDFCREDRDCCGAEGTGLPGEGNVVCQKEPDADIGICRNPNGCSPQGNVCHFKDYICGVSSARNNCCGDPGDKDLCKLDPLGVPRCNGLGEECREPGETCSSSDDCCDDIPCIPDEDGVLRCMYPPDDGDACVPAEGACTINADCCAGLTCVRPIGSTQGICGLIDQQDGGVGDASTPDSGTPTSCAQYGQMCDNDNDCCNDIPCTDNICRIPIG
jgi:hypothetical protein